MLLYIYLKIIGLKNITINPKNYENIDGLIDKKKITSAFLLGISSESLHLFKNF
jgi:hypothetical protein